MHTQEEDSSESVSGLQYVSDLANTSTSGANANQAPQVTYSTAAPALQTLASSTQSGQPATITASTYAQLQGTLPLSLLQNVQNTASDAAATLGVNKAQASGATLPTSFATAILTGISGCVYCRCSQ